MPSWEDEFRSAREKQLQDLRKKSAIYGFVAVRRECSAQATPPWTSTVKN